MSSARDSGIDRLAAAIVADARRNDGGRDLGIDDVTARRLARKWFDELGLVTLAPELLEAVKKAHEVARLTREERSSSAPGTSVEQTYLPRFRQDVQELTLARLRLADAVLAQLRRG